MMPDAASLSTPLAYALAYAQRGWHVLPLVPGEKRPMGKLVPRGALDATIDGETIRRWWQAVPTAGIGIAMAPSGLVALDIDPRNGGAETFDALQAEHGSLRSEVMAYTGGGGEHHVFVLPPGSTAALPGKLGPGVDVKANGYICVEPSLHPSGKKYGWEAGSSPLDGVAPSPLPDWLRSLRVDLSTPDRSASTGRPVDAEVARDVREALYVLDADDYATWVQAGMALHSTGWGGPAYAMWAAWSQQSNKFDAQGVRAKWASFHTPEERGRGVTVAWVFQRAKDAGWINPRASIKSAPVGPADAAQGSADGLPLLSLAQLREKSAAVSWVVKHVLPSESLGVMFGGSGTFKSFIALDCALHVAHGLRWLGRKTRKASVIIIAAEGGSGIWRRIDAWHRQQGLSWSDAEVYVVPVAVDLLHDAEMVVSAARALGVEPQLVVVDTLSQTFPGEENSATEISGYLRELGLWFRSVWRCAVLVIHHTGHMATERPRGSSAIRANVDFMIGVFRSETEMIATMTVGKQKDGELLPDQTFHLQVVELDQDVDGDPTTSLVARAVMSDTEKAELVAHEARRGRSGHHPAILTLAQNGMQERDLRRAFYETCELQDQDSRRQAYYRALNWAKRAGFIDIAQGIVIVLKETSA